MKQNYMQEMLKSSYLSGSSSAYIEDLYEQYLESPHAVDENWRKYFESLSAGVTDISHAAIRNYFSDLSKRGMPAAAPISQDVQLLHRQNQIQYLINAYRSHGHHQAQLDPLELHERRRVADLELSSHKLSESDLDQEFVTEDLVGCDKCRLREIISILKETYCGSIGVEFMHITNQEELVWLQQRLESNRGKASFSPEQKKRILQKLTNAEGLEKYLGSRFVGQKRFSLEGSDSLIPLFDELTHRAGAAYAKELVIGMAHRGRLNMLVNMLGKSPEDLCQEFEGKNSKVDSSGDVKYHMGFSSDIKTSSGGLHLALAFNPSHLEIIAPVVEGSVRARQERRDDDDKNKVIPFVVHGDAAVAGQGVVMETLNFSQARGFFTGGTIHVIINNQVGFTTSNPLDARSTLYCSDIFKMVQAPIIHVNGDDAEAVIFAAQIALDYRMRFHKDVVIDLVSYRRHGHNEADEPSATQPLMYQKVKAHKTPREIYAEKLVSEGVVTTAQVQEFVDSYRKKLDAGHCVVEEITVAEKSQYAINWDKFLNTTWDMQVDTNVAPKVITQIAKKLYEFPGDFALQAQVRRVMDHRRKMAAGEIPMDWGFAENMAYATLVNEGIPVRLCGQDSGRGTFAHRHAVLHDYKNGDVYIPLQNVNAKQAKYTIIDSVLSEEAVIGFEFGYATADPNTLVIWEAQFGDFANGAQVVIDQFLSSGEQKWGRLCGLTLLLPHGYEGMGPEHSSARLERYLQLCAQQNMQVCIPSTPAQIYHMLRRQAIRPYRKPLIVMSPKSLLRHKLVVSPLEDLSKGQFHPVIHEIDDVDAKKVKRVILCSGKVYYDLLQSRRDKKQNDIAIIRIEQLYPFPEDELSKEIAKYKKVKQVIWCQEEPKNQGAWYSMQHHMRACLLQGQELMYAGREASASPATGYPALHVKEQMQLVKDALG